MEPVVHDFSDSVTVGECYEDVLDKHFSHWYHIEKATRQQQSDGIDRIFIDRRGRRISVEYKTDLAAARTGRIAIEVASVEESGKLGWAYTSLAQHLIEYVPGWRKIFIANMLDVKKSLPDWHEKYKSLPVPNTTYTTRIIPVPLPDFKQRLSPLEMEIPSGEFQ
jgi:hypothetical protein